MGKARGKVKRTKSFNYNTNRKKLWKKSKQLPAIKCAEIKAAWDPKKSIEANMKRMGLAADSNKTLKIDDTKDTLLARDRKDSLRDAAGDAFMEETTVADLLEKTANTVREPKMKLSEPEAQFCMEMIEKHGNDYKAMARDPDNYYQETPKQIKNKIRKFQQFPGRHADFFKRKGLSQMELDAS